MTALVGAGYPVLAACRLVGLARSSYYYAAKVGNETEAGAIVQVFTRIPVMGRGV